MAWAALCRSTGCYQRPLRDRCRKMLGLWRIYSYHAALGAWREFAPAKLLKYINAQASRGKELECASNHLRNQESRRALKPSSKMAKSHTPLSALTLNPQPSTLNPKPLLKEPPFGGAARDPWSGAVKPPILGLGLEYVLGCVGSSGVGFRV